MPAAALRSPAMLHLARAGVGGAVTKRSCNPHVAALFAGHRAQGTTCSTIRTYSVPAAQGEDAPHAYLTPSSADKTIVTLTLNRPSARNAISRRMLTELLSILREELPSSYPSARALIVRSACPPAPAKGAAFCAGADLKERKTMSKQQVERFLSDLRTAFTALERTAVPTIAAIDGLAMGGGMEMALCTDLRVAGVEVKGLGLTETKLGIIPGAGGTQRMTRLIGLSKTKDLIYTAKLLSAPQAYELGIIDYIASSAESDTTTAEEGEGPAYTKALQIAAQIAQNGPLAVRAAKLAIDKGASMDSETGLDFERACYNTLLHTKDRLEGLQAFAEKRSPKYLGE